MHRLVLRPVLVVLTLGMLVVALFQSVGRLGVLVLDDLELAANQWLSAQQIRVSGLEGSWRLLNPVVMIDRIDLPAGHLADVVVELDWIESLIRNRFVARQLIVRDAQVLVERRDGKWRLAGSVAGGEFDFSGLLYQGDELSLNGSLALRREDEQASAPIRVSYAAVNRGGMHRHTLNLRNQGRDCEDPCRLGLEYQASEGLWPFWDETVQLHVQGRRFRLPEPVLGVSALDVDTLGLNWHRRDDASGGWLSLVVDGLGLPSDVELAGKLQAQVEGHGDVHQALVDHLEVRQTAHIEHISAAPFASALRMPVVRIRKDAEVVALWADKMDLGNAAEFLRNGLQGVERLRSWLDALNVKAEALNLRGYVHLPTGDIGYATTLAGIELDGHRGVPYVRGGAGELVGYTGGVQVKLKGQDMVMQFPDTFTDKWQMPYMQGVVQGWFGNGYMGLRGRNLRAETLHGRASGGFAISRPEDRREQRLTLLINFDEVEIQAAKTFVPYNLDPGLARWIAQGPRAGLLSETRFGFHGQTHPQAGRLSRRAELTSRISDGRVQYHADWPEVTELTGLVSVAGPTVRVVVDDALSAGARLPGSRAVLRDNAAYVDLELRADMPTQVALDFSRDTPLRESLAFIGPDWSGGGAVRLEGNLHIPLGDDAEDGADLATLDLDNPVPIEVPMKPDAKAGDLLAVDIFIGMVGTDLDMPDYRLTMNDLDGRVRYRYPDLLRGSDIRGSLFGNPVLIGARSEPDEMILSFVGRASHQDVLEVIDTADPGVFSGSMDFAADLHIATHPDHVTHLELTSDLQGMALSLPAEFSKASELPRELEVSLQFLDEYQVVSFRHGSAEGWVHVDDAPMRGAVGFGRAPPVVDSRANHLLLTGRLEGFALQDVVPDDGDNSDALLDLRLADLQVGHIDLDEFRIDEALLNGDITGSGFTIDVTSEAVAGTLSLDGDEPLMVSLDYVVLPESEAEEEGVDPLKPQLIAELPLAEVELRSLRVGELDYGRWNFRLEPQEQGVLLADLDAELRGVSVVAPEGVLWIEETNESIFRGSLSAGNLAEVLPLWDFAPSLETDSASLAGDLRWAGSPANVDIDLLVGEAEVRADAGRFVDVESGGGAMRIFSLMNFNTIAKRLRGDFSDVTGKGVSFDKVRATVAFDAGSLTFVEPMKVKGTGSSFEVAGTVDLVDGVLDNEMVVTLPVSKGLPWYAAYIALANPLAGAGMLVGERVLRKPIEQFSSAKYQISGTLDDPDVNLVGVFDTSMDEDSEAEPEPEAQAADSTENTNEGESGGKEPNIGEVDAAGESVVEVEKHEATY